MQVKVTVTEKVLGAREGELACVLLKQTLSLWGDFALQLGLELEVGPGM